MINKKLGSAALLTLLLGVVGVAFGQAQSQAPGQNNGAAVTCPVNGDELPCSNCCPLNGGK